MIQVYVGDYQMLREPICFLSFLQIHTVGVDLWLIKDDCKLQAYNSLWLIAPGQNLRDYIR
jgi:hypothetical protein